MTVAPCLAKPTTFFQLLDHATPIGGRVSFDPFRNCPASGSKLFGQCRIGVVSGLIESFDFLPLLLGQGGIRMKFHQNHTEQNLSQITI
nr:hypothetical protein [Spirosoma endbachense]